jgi:surface polysaccharide O-acyltransferase-like enzyme
LPSAYNNPHTVSSTIVFRWENGFIALIPSEQLLSLSSSLAHTHPFHAFGPYGSEIYFILDTIGQFDVPFFFVAAGYFLAERARPGELKSLLLDSTRKLGSMYLFGTLLFVSVLSVLTVGAATVYGRSPTNALLTRFPEGFSPAELLYYGNAIAIPMWFLTALLFSISFLSAFVAIDRTQYLLPVAAGVHLFGIVGQNFPMLFDVPFPTRDALFFGFFYLALGFQLRRTDWRPDENHSRLYLGAIGALMVIQVLEQYAVSYLLRGLSFNQGVFTTEYTVSTAFLTLAIFAYALSNPQWGKGTVLPKLETYAVGIYLVHAPMYETFEVVSNVTRNVAGIGLRATLLWHVLIAPVVFVLSLVAYVLMARAGVIEIGGSHVPWLDRLRTRFGASDSDNGPAAD